MHRQPGRRELESGRSHDRGYLRSTADANRKGHEIQMSRSVHLSSDKRDQELRRRLRGKRLVSRTNWMIRQAAYVLACVVAAVAGLMVFGRALVAHRLAAGAGFSLRR